MEEYLKQIAKELKLIRLELQKENEYEESYSDEQLEITEVDKPEIADQLNHMFKR